MAQLDRHAEMIPESVALRYEGCSTTWRDLRARVQTLAGSLSALGIGGGDRVAILMGNRPEFVEVVLAAGWLGAIAVPINFRHTAAEIAYVLDDADAAVLVADELTDAVARDSVQRARRAPVHVAIGVGGGASYEDLVASGQPAPFIDVDESDVALIMYTSGTTGRPKGAMLTHRNLIAQSSTIIRAFRLDGEGEISLVTSPMFHIGAIGSIAPCLMIGATIVIARTGAFAAGDVLRTIEAERVSTAFMVPTQWQALCDEPGLAQRDLSRLRILGWGAAPASDALLHRMAESFPAAQAVALFGQTEMSPVTCVLEADDALRKLGSVGRPVSTVTARVVALDGTDVAQGEVGEIVYRGVGLMLGYWRNREATATAFAGGWFHSGDLVRVDEEGFVYIVDRVKDMIISGGENIYCTEVENVLATHEAIREVAVIGRSHPRWGETPIAVVVLAEGADAFTIEQLRTYGARSLARYKLPTSVEFVDALPRNAAGKVLKAALRERAAHG